MSTEPSTPSAMPLSQYFPIIFSVPAEDHFHFVTHPGDNVTDSQAQSQSAATCILSADKSLMFQPSNITQRAKVGGVGDEHTQPGFWSGVNVYRKSTQAGVEGYLFEQHIVPSMPSAQATSLNSPLKWQGKTVMLTEDGSILPWNVEVPAIGDYQSTGSFECKDKFRSKIDAAQSELAQEAKRSAAVARFLQGLLADPLVSAWPNRRRQ
ncbi:uncharacterized protein MKK02DRAFT_38821 [Dioszegia hungarica]|uniref:Uncharacterized protein n=1 Tax=Dioszegia hungarica TaxID=4972 RepID=A0AA38H819_9TREE|nr:uncharacterized protein MKK02DRAFT_38821 [Dioszegia hungarica]KAI9634149.1 hypothetical protein MKK02DRAFT_38821 [Dioszegia hungarica]